MLLQEFRGVPVARGDAVELAVGVVIGAAFGTVVSSLVVNLVTPLVGLPGRTDFGPLAWTVRGAEFR